MRAPMQGRSATRKVKQLAAGDGLIPHSPKDKERADMGHLVDAAAKPVAQRRMWDANAFLSPTAG